MKDRISEERISMRTSFETKQYLAAAAALSGYNNLTSFILATAHKEAQRVIKEAEVRVLSENDMVLVRSVLNNHPKLSKLQKSLLQQAAKRYENNQNEDFSL